MDASSGASAIRRVSELLPHAGLQSWRRKPMNIVFVCIAAVAAPLHRGLLVAVAAATVLSACAHTAPEVQTPWMSAT